MDEEVVVLEEQLAAAHADVERLEALLADAEAKLAGRDGEVGELRHQIEGALAERQERESESESLQAALDEARTASRAAAARYRDVVLAHEPELPAELVGGSTAGGRRSRSGRGSGRRSTALTRSGSSASPTALVGRGSIRKSPGRPGG